MPHLDRRSFLLGTGAALLLAACSSGDDDDDDSTSTTATTDGATEEEGTVLGTAFNRNSFLQAGIPQRATFVLFETSGGFVAVDDAPAELTFTARQGASEVSGTVTRHGDELDRPYYPVELTFPTTGPWEVETALPSGATLASNVQVSETVTFPQIGQPLPGAPTPTTAAPLGVATICTREPACPFHEVSLDTALAEGRPVAVLVSTPAYCQVAICGPVLDLLMGADPGDLAVIHLEAFPNGSGSDPGPPSPVLTQTLGLDFEPVLYVAGADGTVTARLDSIYDSVELRSALGSATS